jgi:hypothetical protein
LAVLLLLLLLLLWLEAWLELASPASSRGSRGIKRAEDPQPSFGGCLQDPGQSSSCWMQQWTAEWQTVLRWQHPAQSDLQHFLFNAFLDPVISFAMRF